MEKKITLYIVALASVVAAVDADPQPATRLQDRVQRVGAEIDGGRLAGNDGVIAALDIDELDRVDVVPIGTALAPAFIDLSHRRHHPPGAQRQ